MIYFYIFFYMLSVGLMVDMFYSLNNLEIRNGVRKINLAIIFIPPLLLAALRMDVGTDYNVYLNEKIPGVLNNWNVGIEPLYRLIIKISAQLGNYQIVFAVTHIIIIYFIVAAILKNSGSISLSILAFWGTGFFNYSLNIMRQAIVMAIFLYAVQFIDSNKKKYFILIIIACFFHTSAIIYLVYFFVRNIKIRAAFSFVLIGILWFTKDIVRNFIVIVLDYIGKYSQYFGSVLDTNKNGWAFLIVNLIIYGLFQCVLSNSKSDKLLNRYVFIQYISTLITVLSSVIPNYERLMYLFMIVQVISIPVMVKKINSLSYRIIFIIIIILLYGLLFYRLFIISNIGDTFPYTSIFNSGDNTF